MLVHKGACDCGNVAFEVQGELTIAVACRCPRCSRSGSLMWFVHMDRLHLLSSGEGLGTYTFDIHEIKRHFCQTCGIQPYAEVVDSQGHAMAAINIRCLEEIDVATVSVAEVDSCLDQASHALPHTVTRTGTVYTSRVLYRS